MPAVRPVLAALVAAGALSLAACTGSPALPPGPDADATTQPGGDPTPSPDATAGAPAPDDPTPGTDAPQPPGTGGAPEPGDGRAVVEPLIAWVAPGTAPATVEVAGWVPEIVEEGGTCTATVVGSGVSVEGPAYADASSTSCGLLVLPVEAAGRSVVLTYSSTTSVGESGPVPVTS